MNIGIIGTGHVAQTLAGAWSRVGHSVTLGSRTPEAKDLSFPVASLGETARGADVIVNATPGGASKDTLSQIDVDALAGKLLIDAANATTPQFELVYPNASLGEELQKMLPDVHVVKSLNTCSIAVEADPASLAPSSIFVSGDSAEAKVQATQLLQDLGWSKDAVVDLGGIASAKGPEHYFIMFATLMQALKRPFNIRLVH